MSNKTTFYTEEERKIREMKEKEKKIREKVGKTLNIIQVFLWIFVGILAGLLLASILINTKTNNHNADHVFVEAIATGDGYYAIELNNTDREIYATTATGPSMYPAMYYESYHVYLRPNSINDLHVGDVIAYQIDGMDNGITHRITKISQDEKGWYARTKGDNNLLADDWKIRYKQIEGVLIAITY